jgi:basic membrane lipoprotein Med (substrate-binding protein (PBP1-ABC) superfamily)
LWQIIDDIDTASDMAKSNDVAYRNMVEKLQKKRWNTKITTDGYKLDLTKMEVPK